MKNKLNPRDIEEREIPDREKNENQKLSNKKRIIQYQIPLVLLILIGIIYIPTQINILLIPFGILMLITLFGWDGNSRTCNNCHKWNSIVWTDNKKVLRTTTQNVKTIFGKNKTKTNKEYVVKTEGKCMNCGKTLEKEKNRKI